MKRSHSVCKKKKFLISSNYSPHPLPSVHFFGLWRRKLGKIACNRGNSRDSEAKHTEFGCNCLKCVFNPNCTDERKEHSCTGEGERAGNKCYDNKSRGTQLGHCWLPLELPEVSFLCFNPYCFIPKYRHTNHTLSIKVKFFKNIYWKWKSPTKHSEEITTVTHMVYILWHLAALWFKSLTMWYLS